MCEAINRIKVIFGFTYFYLPSRCTTGTSLFTRWGAEDGFLVSTNSVLPN